ncbi:hypothetical protein F2P79_023221 [Pimephales promelas]|nr:hypothetical protein F2P79_023221 [Pimephales promelas]
MTLVFSNDVLRGSILSEPIRRCRAAQSPAPSCLLSVPKELSENNRANAASTREPDTRSRGCGSPNTRRQLFVGDFQMKSIIITEAVALRRQCAAPVARRPVVQP